MPQVLVEKFGLAPYNLTARTRTFILGQNPARRLLKGDCKQQHPFLMEKHQQPAEVDRLSLWAHELYDYVVENHDQDCCVTNLLDAVTDDNKINMDLARQYGEETMRLIIAQSARVVLCLGNETFNCAVQLYKEACERAGGTVQRMDEIEEAASFKVRFGHDYDLSTVFLKLPHPMWVGRFERWDLKPELFQKIDLVFLLA